MVQPKAAVIVCSDIASHLESKNLTFIEAFDALASASFPAQAHFFAVAKTWGLAEGQTHGLTLRLMGPDGREVIRAGEHKITPTPGVKVHTAVSRFANINFPSPGLYEVQALLGETAIGAIAVNLTQATGA